MTEAQVDAYVNICKHELVCIILASFSIVEAGFANGVGATVMGITIVKVLKY